MATTTIALTEPAYERLKRQKLPGESFSDVVLREIPEPCETAGDVLKSFEANPPPRVAAKRIDAFLRARPALESEPRAAKSPLIADTTFLSHLLRERDRFLKGG